jgi:hypothetical protein
MEPIWIILTTYKRLDIATKTIQGLKENFRYDNIGWIITDDGSGPDHLNHLVSVVGPSYTVFTYDGNRKGVGHNMNWALHKVFDDLGGSLILMMEDDWYLEKPFDVEPYTKVLLNNPNAGMIRFGYAAAGLEAELVSMNDRLLWDLHRNSYTYRFTGHPSLRHKRFHETYGYYAEGLAPGLTELDMCAKVNAKDGPRIYIPYEFNQWGAFGHIGSESLADVEPEK